MMNETVSPYRILETLGSVGMGANIFDFRFWIRDLE